MQQQALAVDGCKDTPGCACSRLLQRLALQRALLLVPLELLGALRLAAVEAGRRNQSSGGRAALAEANQLAAARHCMSRREAGRSHRWASAGLSSRAPFFFTMVPAYSSSWLQVCRGCATEPPAGGGAGGGRGPLLEDVRAYCRLHYDSTALLSLFTPCCGTQTGAGVWSRALVVRSGGLLSMKPQ